MELEIEHAWRMRRRDLAVTEDEKALADFDACCEKSKEVYFALKKIGLWPKSLVPGYFQHFDPDTDPSTVNENDIMVDHDDLNDARAVVDILRALDQAEVYDLKAFWDWLKQSLSAALRGEEIEYSHFDTVLVVNLVNYTGYEGQDCGHLIREIILIGKLIDAGVTDITPDSWRFLRDKVEWASNILDECLVD